MKKKSMILGGLLMAVAITGYSVSGTYAKYISAVDVTDEARVAKWDIDFTDTDGTELVDNQQIDLFQESYTFDTDNHVYVKSLEAGKRVVAPGTEGSYSFDIKGITETNYTLKVEVLKTSKNDVVLKGTDGTTVEYDPIRFSVDGGTTWVDFAGLNTAINAQFAGKVYGPNATVAESVSIQWKWVFDADEATAANATNTGTGAVAFVSDDEKDTTLGNEIVDDATSHTIKLDLKVTAEQTKAAATN